MNIRFNNNNNNTIDIVFFHGINNNLAHVISPIGFT